MKSRIIVWVFLLGNGILIHAQDFKFSDPEEWECENGVYEVKGTYQEISSSYVWLFLKDIHGHFYLQSPSIEMLSNREWEHSNIRYKSRDISYIWAVGVDEKGDKTLNKWVKKKKFKDISLAELKKLSGYKRLSSERTPEPCAGFSGESCNKTITPESEVLIIADFEKNKNHKGFPLGGSTDSWVSDKEHYEIRSEIIGLDDEHMKYGEHVLDVQFAPRLVVKEPDWRGGGLVLKMLEDAKCLDISAYGFLEFDMRNTAGNTLSELKVKLEDSQTNKTIEVKLVDFGGSFEDGWSSVKIPIKKFSKMPVSAPLDWQRVNLKAVKNLTFIGVINQYVSSCRGVLWIDNVRITK